MGYPFDKALLKKATISNIDLRGIQVCIVILFVTMLMPFVCFLVVPKLANKSSIAITSEYVHDGQLSLTLSGDDIAFENCFAYTTDKGIEYAVYYSEYDSSVTFNYYYSAINIYIPDSSGDTHHFLISPAEEN